MDEADYGNQYAEFFRQQALRIHFRRSRIPALLGTDFKSVPNNAPCLDCGEEIGEARMKANPAAVRCMGCQTKKERKR